MHAHMVGQDLLRCRLDETSSLSCIRFRYYLQDDTVALALGLFIFFLAIHEMISFQELLTYYICKYRCVYPLYSQC